MTNSVPPVRTRFAPSPTGLLHIGNARTAVFAWLLARHHGGQFLVRVEDTDRARYVPGAVQVMIDTLEWLGVDIDEGPELGGPYGPYVQSERKDIYTRYAEQLLAENKAYRCYCSAERLAELRAEQERQKLPTGYDRHCRYLSAEERAEREAAGEQSVIRFATPLEGTTVLHDALRGLMTYENEKAGDFVLLKSDGYPVYHFAVVIDDHLMEISHVLRGEEYISTGVRDTLLHEALGWDQPVYIHGSTILAPDRAKLAKRHGATAVLEFREMGIVPEALLNFLALLGAAYSADREVYSREELISLFDVDRMSAAPAIFDRTKLEWMNGHYINHILSLAEVTDRCLPYLERAGLLGNAPGEYVEQV
ncbi:MAG: glutamate--tRNA ligase, partial [Chloroflexota bacterium]|nr:glutamate--tRNA ligase [Chloroflexota bacterium]